MSCWEGLLVRLPHHSPTSRAAKAGAQGRNWTAETEAPITEEAELKHPSWRHTAYGPARPWVAQLAFLYGPDLLA